MADKKKGNRYLKGWKSISSSVKQKALIILGGMFSIIWIFGIMLAFREESGITKGDIPMMIVLLIPAVLMVVRGIRIGKRNDLARRYAQIFESDRDGILTMEELKMNTGKEDAIIIKELDLLFRKGYFKDCNFRRGDFSGLVVISGIEEAAGRKEFVYVKCSSCGGVTKIPAGNKGTCSFCGTPIQG